MQKYFIVLTLICSFCSASQNTPEEKSAFYREMNAQGARVQVHVLIDIRNKLIYNSELKSIGYLDEKIKSAIDLTDTIFQSRKPDEVVEMIFALIESLKKYRSNEEFNYCGINITSTTSKDDLSAPCRRY